MCIRDSLQTMPFPLEKVQINGFVGNVCIKIKGTETMANYIRLLCRFGAVSYTHLDVYKRQPYSVDIVVRSQVWGSEKGSR